jgi:hypothetical protein
MKVARQFIAWYRCEKGNRPRGYGMIGSHGRATLRTINQPGVRIRPCPMGRIPVWTAFQAINCLATIISPFLLRRPELRRTSRDNKPAACLRNRSHIDHSLEDSLPDVASRSFRRRGEVGRTTTRTACPAKLLVYRQPLLFMSEVGRTIRYWRAMAADGR